MACNCGGGRAARRRVVDQSGRPAPSDSTVYSVQYSDGSTETFGSRLEADAANARSGYRGVVRRI